MSHILIILEAIETLESKSADPPTGAQASLMEALQAADEYAHDTPDSEILAVIEQQATFIKSYLDVVNPPSDIRLQSYANALNGIVP